MGTYDTVHGGLRHGQVKAWGCALRDLVPGDHVCAVAGASDYSVRTSDAKAWTNVDGGTIVSVTATPTKPTTFTTTGRAAA